MKMLLAAVSLAFLSACAPVQAFRPVDVGQIRSPDGYAAAVYSISSGHGDWDNVVVHVWTLGVAEETKPQANKKKRVLAGIAWRVNNQSKDEVQLNLAATRLLLRSYSASPEPAASTLTVAAGSENTTQLSFVLPEGTDADVLQSFEISWSLSGNNQKYSQTTRFERPKSSGGVQPGFGIGVGIGL